ncbi:MAG TPA: CHRD domain-containing protein [Steroidobacteraceae bacterium]|nr:CHRD domain-containing protein [Steroidobacteraceae bacterium]
MSFRVFRLAPIALAASFVVGAIGTAQAVDVKVKLTGDQEVPAVASTATGVGTIVIKDDKTVSGSIKTTGIDGTVAHIHLAEPGKNGPPIITLTKTENTWSVPEASKLTDEQYKAFKEGNLYVNIHSAEHKGGEIRTQLKP